jgi:hypothetical protein
MAQMPGIKACSIDSSLTSLLSPSLHSRKMSSSSNSIVTSSSSTVSSHPSARVTRFARGRISVASKSPTWRERAASR